jgi:helix-turn-helix protein
VPKRRLVITAVLAGASRNEVAGNYHVSRGWISRLMARYRAKGEAAIEPRSRRPYTSPNATAHEVIDLALRLRKELTEPVTTPAQTPCAGISSTTTTTWCPGPPSTGSWSGTAPWSQTAESGRSPPTCGSRAEQPNETWQSDFAHYRLTTPTAPPARTSRS